MGRKSAVLARTAEVAIPPPEPPVDADNELEEEVLEAGEEDAGDDAAVTDNVGEQSVEINVESLIAELESASHVGRKPCVLTARRRLEDYLERKRVAHDLEDFEDFEVEE